MLKRTCTVFLMVFLVLSSLLILQTQTPLAVKGQTPKAGENHKNPSTIALNCTGINSGVGFGVRMEGRLLVNDLAGANADIVLAYSADKGQTWANFILAKTNSDGDFTAESNLPQSGIFLVNATWAGNSTCQSVREMVNFAVTKIGGQNLLSVSSNSTISTLTFNTTRKTLSFTVEGASRSTGYAKLYLAKSYTSSITGLTVQLDGKEAPYTTQSEGDSWLVTIHYHQSSHRVDIQLASPTAAAVDNLFGYWVTEALLIFIVGVATAVLLVFRKKKIQA